MLEEGWRRWSWGCWRYPGPSRSWKSQETDSPLEPPEGNAEIKSKGFICSSRELRFVLNEVQTHHGLWSVAHQAPPWNNTQREYWSGYLFLSPGYFPNPDLLHCRQIFFLPSEPPRKSSKTPEVFRSEYGIIYFLKKY